MKFRYWILGLVVAGAVALVVVTRARAQGRQTAPREPANTALRREQWFYGQREYPLGYIPAGARLKALAQAQKLRRQLRSLASTAARAGAAVLPASVASAITLSQSAWTMIGPQPTLSFGNLVSGRVTALAFDPRDTTNKTIYLGAAEGGVWRTTNGGQTWSPLTDFEPSLAVGSIALDPTTNPTTIYVGTGEENFAIDNYFGAGVLKSADGGITWTKDSTFGSGGAPNSPAIGALAVDPGNNQVLLAAVQLANTKGGIWRSSDGGQTWTMVLTEASVAEGTDVVFDSKSPGVAYAALGDLDANNAGNGVYKSTDDGATWTALSLPGFVATSAGRIALALGPPAASGKPSELLASVAQSANNGNLLGVWLTTDGGTTWAQLTDTPDFCEGQCWYDMAVAIDPANPSAVYAGGSNNFGGLGLTASQDGGVTWSPDLSDGNFIVGGPSPTGHLHTDTHVIRFTPNGTQLMVGNDGGVWVTANVPNLADITWGNLNNTLAITQFYPGIAIAPANPSLGMGGTQDNGSQAFSGSQQWQELPTCGDGGYNAFTPSSSIQYAICAADEGLWMNSGAGWVWAGNGIGTCTATPTANCYFSVWAPPLAMDPENPSVMYFAAVSASLNSYVVYQTTNRLLKNSENL